MVMNRRIEIVERLLLHARGDFGADGGLRIAFLDGDKAAGLLDAFDDRRQVHRPDRPEIDQLDVDSHARKFFHRLEPNRFMPMPKETMVTSLPCL